MEDKKKRPDAKRLLQLFIDMFCISSFTFGGGFVIVTLMKQKFVDGRHWLEEEEMLDMTAIAESSPGAIAVNAAILVGWHVAGFAGMLISVLATILPPMIILSVVSFFYATFASNVYVATVLRGMQAGVAAVILSVVFDLGKDVVKKRSAVDLILMAAAFAATFFFGVNVVYIILAAALIGVAEVLLEKRKEGGRR